MSMIKVENLTFSYPSGYENIFENVNFKIDTDWKLGFIGRNGRGKTTFLKLLMGMYAYEGKISSSVIFDYFPYQADDESLLTNEVLAGICPNAQDWEIIKELSLLGVAADVLWQPYETLSKGQQTKVMLAALFLNEGHFLLIDEPTDHLDAAGRQAVASYLEKKKGFILVSHDREFLDSCIDHVLSLNRSDIEVQSGNFSSWYENFQRRQMAETTQDRRLQKDIERLRKAAGQTGVWAGRVESSKYGCGPADRGYIGHKSAKMMKRAKSIQSRQQKAADEKAGLLKNVEKTEPLKLFPMEYRARRMISVTDLVIFYGGKQVCGPLSFEVCCGDRIALDGGNGSGKSSLIKLLANMDVGRDSAGAPGYSGTINTGSGLVISYVPQDASFLEGTLSDFAGRKGIDESLFKTVLRKMDFDRGQFEKDLRELSVGQKKKVLLAGSVCQRAHLYIWDEPLNYIDIYSRMQIEDLIAGYSPSMIFVEHDRAFRQTVATRQIKL